MIRNDAEIVFGAQIRLHLVQGQSTSSPVVFSILFDESEKKNVNPILVLKNKKNDKVFVNKQIVLGGLFQTLL